jgi:hypothetical protein
LPLGLNQLFVLNFVGYLVLAAVFWFIAPKLGNWRWLVDVALIVYVITVFAAWMSFGAPNPQGYLGYLSKGLEAVLLMAVVAHLWSTVRASQQPATAPV